MQVFVVLNASRPRELGQAIATQFPNDHLSLKDGQWMVAATLLTSRDVSDRIGVTDGLNGNAIVVALDAYWGRAPSSIWEWVSTRKSIDGR